MRALLALVERRSLTDDQFRAACAVLFGQAEAAEALIALVADVADVADGRRSVAC